MTKDSITARVAGPASEIGAAAWNACANPDAVADPHPFTRYEFFAACEESGSATARTGWKPAHLVVEDGGRVVALLPTYLKNHSQGEYVFDSAWADALERSGGDYYPKLQASVPFTPVTGSRLLVSADTGVAAGREALLATGATAVRQLKASSLHITFLTQEEWIAAGEIGYLQRTDQQFHWLNPGYRSFDQFLGELSSSKRKNLRKERASVRDAGVEFDWLTGSDISEAHWDRFFAFYMDTGGRKWGRPYLTREFFDLIGTRMADRLLLFLACRDDRPIAGALNLIGGDTLYGRYWGCIEEVPFLHFELCFYQAIEWAIDHRLSSVQAGAQGEHKLARGYEPAITRSAHFIPNPSFRSAVADFLEAERAGVAQEIAWLSETLPYRSSLSA